MTPISKPWREAQPGDVLAIGQDYEALVTTLRRWKDERGFSCAELESRTGLTHGYIPKIFGPSRVKALGVLAFGLLFCGLDLKFAIIVGGLPEPKKRRDELQVRSAGEPRRPKIPNGEDHALSA